MGKDINLWFTKEDIQSTNKLKKKPLIKDIKTPTETNVHDIGN